MTDNTKAHLALLGTNTFFAINYICIKYLIDNNIASPYGLGFTRLGICSIMFWILYFFNKTKLKIERADYLRFALVAFMGVFLNQILFLKGLSLTYSIHASLLMLITPILITLLAAWLLKEQLTKYKIFGLFIAIIGAIVLIATKEQNGIAKNPLLGDIMIVGNAAAYAYSFILVKPLMQKYNHIVVIRMMFTLGFLIVIPICFSDFKEIKWEEFSSQAWICLAILTIPGTFFSYLLNLYGIRILGASTAGSYVYYQIVIVAGLAILFLNEPLKAYKLISAALIIMGVIIANKKIKNE